MFGKEPCTGDTIHHFLYPSLGRFDVFMALTMARSASTNQTGTMAECTLRPADTRNSSSALANTRSQRLNST